MLYSYYDLHKKSLLPYSRCLESSLLLLNYLEANNEKYLNFKDPRIDLFQAHYEFINQFIKEYPKPEFNILEVISNKKNYKVTEEVVIDNSFCKLLHFKKEGLVQKPLFIVAPLSGHYATLLRDTVKTSLQDYDVFITDWKNVRDIEVSCGEFGFDDYVDYLLNFMSHIKNNFGDYNMMAVCQPTVPSLVAISYIEKMKLNFNPLAISLMGGPVDTRQSPTRVNAYAKEHDINWFRKNVIYSVPFYYKGAGRSVYPGFLQHSGFVAMNFFKHTEAHIDFFNKLIIGSDIDSNKHKKFYQEYNSVMDLPSKYYIETLEKVFQHHELPRGELIFRNEKISLSDIRKTRILTVEGELDDISGKNQTKVTIQLTKNLPLTKKRHYIAPKVGHFGIFSGTKFRDMVYLEIRKFFNNK